MVELLQEKPNVKCHFILWRILFKVTRFLLLQASKISHSDTKRTRGACTGGFRLRTQAVYFSWFEHETCEIIPCHGYLKLDSCESNEVGRAIMQQHKLIVIIEEEHYLCVVLSYKSLKKSKILSKIKTKKSNFCM